MDTRVIYCGGYLEQLDQSVEETRADSTRGVLAKYAAHVTSASLGAVTDM
jgi:hypothetical protein